MVAAARLTEHRVPRNHAVETPLGGTVVAADSTQARAAEPRVSLPRSESFDRAATPARLGALPTPTVTAVLPRQPTLQGTAVGPVDSRARVIDTQPAATGDTVTPEAAELMANLRVSLSRDRTRLDLPGAAPVMFFGTAAGFDARVNDGRLSINVSTTGELAAQMRVDIDPKTRVMQVTATVDGDSATSTRTLPTDVRDLLKVNRNGGLSPAEGVNAETYRADANPALRSIFADAGIDLSQQRTYYSTDIAFGSVGNTMGGFPFINPREARNLSVTLPGSGTPDTYVAAATTNELSHQLWRDIDNTALTRHNPAATSQQRVAFTVDNLGANDFRTIDTGTVRVPVQNNKQINELVSDAASINTDARDIYRIVPFMDASSAGYAVSAGVLRGELTRVFRERGMSDAAIAEELRSATGLSSDTDAATRRWALTDTELASIQTTYRNVASRTVKTYAAAVERRAASY